MNYENLWPLIPPECDHYAMDEDGEIHAASDKLRPSVDLDQWVFEDPVVRSGRVSYEILGSHAVLANRPTDWRTSLRSRPRPDDGLQTGDWVQCKQSSSCGWRDSSYCYIGYDKWVSASQPFIVIDAADGNAYQFAYCRKDPRKDKLD